MNCEIEIRERQGREPTLHGVIIQEGRAATGGRRELFAPGAIEWPTGGIGIATEHLGDVETRAQVVRERDGRLSITARATEAVQRAVSEGKRFLSVEFTALQERITKGGVREIQRAFVATAALTNKPEYDMTAAEIREQATDIERKDRVWL